MRLRKHFLIVVDMQNDFITGSLGTKEAQGIVPKAAERIMQASKNDEYVIFTMDTHDGNYLTTHEGKNLPVVHCVKGTEGWNIHPDIWAATCGCVVSVFRKSAFGSIGLMEYLSNYVDEQGLEDSELSIELIGVCTDICVISNALMIRSIFPEAGVSVRASCCAGVTPEKHLAALEVMRSCQIKVIEGE